MKLSENVDLLPTDAIEFFTRFEKFKCPQTTTWARYESKFLELRQNTKLLWHKIVLKMLRLFGRNFIFNRNSRELFTRVQNVRFLAVSSRQYSSNFQEGSSNQSNANESSKRDPEKVKRAKLLDVLIISSIGIIGFGYLIVRRTFSGQVHAKSAEGLEQGSGEGLDASGEGGETQIQRKKRKSFKETRVS